MIPEIVRCKIIMADGYQIIGDMMIYDRKRFQTWLNKNIDYDHEEDITEFVFEMMRIKGIKNGGKRKEF